MRVSPVREDLCSHAFCAECLAQAEAKARREALKEAASFVSAASVLHPSPLDGIGSTDLRDMNETAQMAIHATCQTLAMKLRDLAKEDK